MLTGLVEPYPAYADSHLGHLPASWETPRLRGVTRMLVSSVDKHAHEHEQPIRLCNYVDVYKHDFIRDDLAFMRASASTEEVNQFRLRPDDVIITKDSESFADIAVPAYVVSAGDDLVCGYHLAILRSRAERLSGRFLHRALQVPVVAHQFQVAASGVTRFGLSQDDIKSAQIPLPSLNEQLAIARYLDHANARIATAVSAKRELIALLVEQKQVIASRAVTEGLDTRAAGQSTGMTWLENVPRNWERYRAKDIFDDVDERSSSGLEERLSISHLTGVSPRSEKAITMFEAASYVGHKLCRPGDVVINTMWAWMGALGVSHHKGLVSPAYNVYRPRRSNVADVEFVSHLLKSGPYIDMFRMLSTGIRPSRLRFYPDQLLATPLFLPPLSEQRSIIEHIQRETEAADAAISRAAHEIKLLDEFRMRLTADVVTGQFDVRHTARSLPDLDVVTPAADLDDFEFALEDQSVEEVV